MEEELDAGRDSFMFKASFRDGSHVMNDIEVKIKRSFINNNSIPPKEVKLEPTEYFEESSTKVEVEKVDKCDPSSDGYGNTCEENQRSAASSEESDKEILDLENKEQERGGSEKSQEVICSGTQSDVSQRSASSSKESDGVPPSDSSDFENKDQEGGEKSQEQISSGGQSEESQSPVSSAQGQVRPQVRCARGELTF